MALVSEAHLGLFIHNCVWICVYMCVRVSEEVMSPHTYGTIPFPEVA